MEEKIKAKIGELIDYIAGKPVEEVTLNDYTILHEELKDIRFRREQHASNERFRELVSSLPFSACGSVE